MPQFALSAIGRDRPGIVAEVTRALLGHSLNITDSQMAVLSGHFTMMLVVTAPEGTDVDPVQEELARTRDRLSLDALSLSPLGEAEAAGGISVAVAHRHRLRRRPPGHRARGLRAPRRPRGQRHRPRDAARRRGRPGRALRDGARGGAARGHGAEALRAMLDEVGAEQGVDVTVRPLEPDVM